MRSFFQIFIMPNTFVRVSMDWLMNDFAIIFGSSFASWSLWIWHIVTWFSLLCPIVDRKNVLRRLRALNDRSAEHELAGEIITNFKSVSTRGNIFLTSGFIVWKIVLHSLTVCGLNWPLKNVCWRLISSVLLFVVNSAYLFNVSLSTLSVQSALVSLLYSARSADVKYSSRFWIALSITL